MKVLLINPPSKDREEFGQKCFPPVNLLYLASALISEGYEADVLDANALKLDEDGIVRRAASAEPDLVGLSVPSETLPASYKLTSMLKFALPSARMVLGGPHANAIPRRVLEEFKSADYVLRGESEKSIVELCRYIEDKIPVREVEGLFYRIEGGIAENAPVRPKEDIDRLRHPAKELLEDLYRKNEYYMILVKETPIDTLITSRGCPFHCGFCCNKSQKYRARSPENVMEEISAMHEKGIRNFDIADANFTFDKGRAFKIFELIRKEGLKISFRFKSRTDSIDEKLINAAREAGAYLVSLGMESGSQAVLERMKKGTRLKESVEACETVLKAGLKLNTGWIIGYPGETRETVEETVKLIKKIRPTTANINILVPYPGTDVYEYARDRGMLSHEWSANSYKTPWVRLPWIKTYADIKEILREAKNRIYYSPCYMASFAREIIFNMNIRLARYTFQEALKSVKRTVI